MIRTAPIRRTTAERVLFIKNEKRNKNEKYLTLKKTSIIKKGDKEKNFSRQSNCICIQSNFFYTGCIFYPFFMSAKYLIVPVLLFVL